MPDTASDPAAPAPLVPPVSPLLLDRIIRHSDRLAADMLREIPGERVWAARIAVYGGLLIAALFDLPPAARQLALDAHVDGLRVLTGEDGIVGEADRMQALWREITARIDALHAAFGAPGDYGYGTATGDALFALYKLRSLSLDDAKQRALAGRAVSPLQLAALATLAAVLALVCAALSLFCVGALVRAHRIELDHAETRRLLAAAGRRAPPPVPDDCR